MSDTAGTCCARLLRPSLWPSGKAGWGRREGLGTRHRVACGSAGRRARSLD